MLLFSTVLDINSTMTKDSFIQVVLEWNNSSKYDYNIIPDIQWNGEYTVRYGNERLWLEFKENKKDNTIAVRYEKCEDTGVIWDTDYVMNFDTMKMAIRLDRSYTPEALETNSAFSTPHFITLLIQKGFLKDDNDLPVNREPFMINEKNVLFLSDIINGNKKYRLPIIYVSCTYNHWPVDTGLLASKVKGVAHVLVQEDKITDRWLMDLCDEYEYNGAIGIYYPNPSIGHQRFLFHGNSKSLMDKVVRQVILYSNRQLLDQKYTWLGVNASLLEEQLSLKSSEIIKEIENHKKSEDANLQLMQMYEEDLQKLQKQMNAIKNRNEALEAENQGLKNKLDSIDTIPVLNMGAEEDLYPGEIKDILLSVLTDALGNLPEKTRRADIVKDIIEENEYLELSQEKADRIKKLLKNYDGMSGKLRQELKDLGFEITEDGKHYKLTYYNDERYTIIFGKTPSDFRSGKNNAQTVIKMVL